MRIVTRTRLLPALIAAALCIATPALADDSQPSITDARQESQIWTTYALSPYLRAHDLKVVVREGKATLRGRVDEDVNRDLAKQIALGVDGIQNVDNQIEVRADYVAPDRGAERGYGELIDDASITAAVKSKLLWSKQVDGIDADVSTRWGKVTLRGSADSADDSALAERLAFNTRGVNAVVNQLVVHAPTRSTTAAVEAGLEEAGQDVADSWITTKVKSTFMYSSNVNSSSITVSTAEGVVTLSGRVATGAERALAIELAENVRGVRSVQSADLVI